MALQTHTSLHTKYSTQNLCKCTLFRLKISGGSRISRGGAPAHWRGRQPPMRVLFGGNVRKIEKLGPVEEGNAPMAPWIHH